MARVRNRSGKSSKRMNRSRRISRRINRSRRSLRRINRSQRSSRRRSLKRRSRKMNRSKSLRRVKYSKKLNNIKGGSEGSELHPKIDTPKINLSEINLPPTPTEMCRLNEAEENLSLACASHGMSGVSWRGAPALSCKGNIASVSSLSLPPEVLYKVSEELRGLGPTTELSISAQKQIDNRLSKYYERSKEEILNSMEGFWRWRGLRAHEFHGISKLPHFKKREQKHDEVSSKLAMNYPDEGDVPIDENLTIENRRSWMKVNRKNMLHPDWEIREDTDGTNDGYPYYYHPKLGLWGEQPQNDVWIPILSDDLTEMTWVPALVTKPQSGRTDLRCRTGWPSLAQERFYLAQPISLPKGPKGYSIWPPTLFSFFNREVTEDGTMLNLKRPDWRPPNPSLNGTQIPITMAARYYFFMAEILPRQGKSHTRLIKPSVRISLKQYSVTNELDSEEKMDLRDVWIEEDIPNIRPHQFLDEGIGCLECDGADLRR